MQPLPDIFNHWPSAEVFTINDHRYVRVGKRFYSFPQRHRIEKRFVRFLVVLLRMSQIRMALIIDANIKIHAPLLMNCLPEQLSRNGPRMK
ncbi:MAG: hypothetical protein DMG52_33645 [Acidobacteria bacterium]|nr:MAG: hypothetical protein DMG52_33645 [Acidobacteriota bacterium]